MAGDAQDLSTGSLNAPGGGFIRRAGRRIMAGTLSAKVTAPGVRQLTTDFSGLLTVLKQVRAELEAINSAASLRGGVGGLGGVGQGAPTGAAGTTAAASPVGNIVQQATGGRLSGLASRVLGPGGFNYGTVGMGVMAAGGALSTGLGVIENRFQRNVAQSIPISARDAFTASMYSALYKGLEPGRFGAAGMYGGSREQQQAAQQIALGYGTTVAGSQRFMGQAGAMVQATGGTMDISQIAGQVGLFSAPMVANRAIAMGIGTIRQRGELQSPMKIGLEYVKDYEKRNNVTMNEIDFANLRSPGSANRARMKQLYGLSDEAIEIVIDAGMQNMKFRATGAGRNINFASGADLKRIGLDQNVLGLQAQRFLTTSQGREARLFETREGSMVDRLRQEGKIQETLEELEDRFGALLGPMHEFQRALQGVATLMGLVGAGMMVKGMLGGGGGLAGMIPGLGGTAATGVGVATAPGVAGAPAAAGAPMAGAAGMGAAARLGLGAAGVGLGIAGMQTAATAQTAGGAALGIAGATAGGAAIGLALAPATAGLSVPIGAAVGFIGGSAFAAKNYFAGVDKNNVKEGYNEGVGMTDKALIDSLTDYVKNAERGAGGKSRGKGAGPKQRGRFDAFARRRGALLAAALDEALSSGALSAKTSTEGAELRELVDFFGSDEVFNDDKLWSNKGKAAKYVDRIRSSEIWRRFFGSVSDPFSFQVNSTAESQSLVMTGDEMYALGGAQTGDGAFAMTGRDPYPRGGDAIDDRAVGKGDTWNRLDSRMKTRLLALFRASGGRVWLGNGWRSSQQQENMFRDRYVPDASGNIEWNGQRWRHVKGAAAAPPGRSMHEIGLAADLEGDLAWMNAHAGEFQLKHFANVNNEEWHVQPVELPNSRREFEQGGGTSDSGSGTEAGAVAAAPAVAGPQLATGGGGPSISGVNFSIVAAAAASMGGGGGGLLSAPTEGAVAGAAGGGAPEVGAGVLTFDDAVRVAYHAGFRGNALQTMVAIARGESGLNPRAHNPNPPDDSYGLWQINMLGSMGPSRRQQWGLQSNDELFDPNKNARAAFDLSGGGSNFRPWTVYTRGVYNQYMDEAKAAMTSTGLGDAVFDPGVSMMMSGGGNANVSINVQITSTGNVNYDAQALGEAVRPVLSNVMAEISTKRGS